MEIPAGLLDAVRIHCNQRHPDEACGVLAGPRDGPGPRDWWPMRNVAEHARYRYAMDEVEQLHVFKAIDTTGHRVFVIYHSHTDATDRGELSPEDLRHALDPDICHLVVMPATARPPGMRLWKVVDGHGIEQALTVTP